MAESQKKIKQVNIIGSDGKSKASNVNLAPDANQVTVLPTDGSASKAILQDFLFKKFGAVETRTAKKPVIDSEGKPVLDENGKQVFEDYEFLIRGSDGYYKVNPQSLSVWQQWNDYQEILKKRLVGLYDDNGNYQGDFIKDLENDLQAQLTLEEGSNTDIAKNIQAIIAKYNLKDDYALKEDGTKDDTKPITAIDQAIALALIFGNESMWQRIINSNQELIDKIFGFEGTDSEGNEVKAKFEATENNRDAIQSVYQFKAKHRLNFDFDGNPVEGAEITTNEQLRDLIADKSIWQSIIENDQKKKDALWGIYNTEGKLIGHFEATWENLQAIQEFYSGKTFEIVTGYNADGTPITETRSINNPREAYELLVDLDKKSIYQHLVDLRDFWIYLPIEYYGQDSPGNSIVTQSEINAINYINPWEVSE